MWRIANSGLISCLSTLLLQTSNLGEVSRTLWLLVSEFNIPLRVFNGPRGSGVLEYLCVQLGKLST